MIFLDTHIVVHLVTGDLRQREQKLISNHSLAISSIVLWEIAKLHKRKRITFDLSDRLIQNELSAIQVVPVNGEIAQLSCNLDFESADPADEIIAATSIYNNIPLLTRDRTIRSSKLVPLA